MKMFNKTLLAAAMLASAGAANATLVTDSAIGGNEAFLSVYDSVQQKTFNLDMGVTFAQIVANPSAAFAAYSGAGFNLGADANWSSFAAGITSPSSVKYTVLVGSQAAKSFAATGITAIAPNAADPSVLVDSAAININKHANEINVGMGAANSSLINQTPETPYIGQLNHFNVNNVAADIWGGWGHNPLQAYGSSVDFWLAGFHQETYVDDFGDTVTTDFFKASDVSKLGSFILAGNTLSFSSGAPSQVPLPAAVWMFGAGLMGVLRMNRRKAA